MKINLLSDIEDFDSFSMSRYHREIAAGLARTIGQADSIIDYTYKTPAWMQKVCSSTIGHKWLSRINRWVAYPAAAAAINADVFHILDQSHANLILGLEKRKTVITCHDIIPFLSLKGKVDLPRRRISTYPFLIACMKQAAHIIAISESTKRGLVEEVKLPPEKITVVPYGVSENFHPGEASSRVEDAVFVRSNFKLPSDAKIILHVGTAERYKNTPAVIRALSLLLQQKKIEAPLYLLRLGADFFADERELIEELGVSSRIIFGGRVNSDVELARYYRGADVFVFPSIWEGFGWPPLESMSCGTPVVVSNAASLSEVVGDAGLMVEPPDYRALANNIERILTEGSLWQELSTKGLQRAQTFSWNRAAEKTFAVYQSVLS